MDDNKNLPLEFINRLKQLIPESKLEKVIKTYNTEKPLSIRINTLKTDKKSVSDFFISENIEFKDISWYSDALIVDRNAKTKITDSFIYKEGLIYFQNLSSMLPAVIMDPKPNEKILDIAAAPGSKTSQIAQMLQNTGEIIANDISRKRLFRLISIIDNMGIMNVKTMQIPGEHIWKKYPNYFDKVLIDVPCSMEGRFYLPDPKSYKDWSLKKIKVLSYLQKRLISSAFYTIKPGGIMVYSTCTLGPEENEEIIQYLLEKEKGHVRILDTKIRFDSPILKWKNKVFDAAITKTMRIFPTNDMEGFFVAKIRRLS